MKTATLEEIRALSDLGEIQACADTIEDEIEALDEEFSRDETMTADVHGERRAALLEKRRLVHRRKERVRDRASRAPAAAPSPGPAQESAPKLLLDAAQNAELDTLYKQIAEAGDRHDADAMLDILNSEHFGELDRSRSIDRAFGLVKEGGFSAGAMLALHLQERNRSAILFRAHVARRHKLEERIKALESRPVMEYRGVWKADEDYRPGDLVTDHGSMFYCSAPTRDRPASTDAWQLCVKRGADGRDVR